MIYSKINTFCVNPLSLPILQKGSPYLDDADKLIDLAKQLGIIDLEIQKHISNATKCSTWNAVQESHIQNGETVAFKIENIVGLMILLGMGLGISLITAIVETIYHKMSMKKGTTAIARAKWAQSTSHGPV